MSVTVNDIINAIATVGFPIACCCFLLWQGSRQDQYNREQMDKLRETLDRNTRSIDKLTTLVSKMLGGKEI